MLQSDELRRTGMESGFAARREAREGLSACTGIVNDNDSFVSALPLALLLGARRPDRGGDVLLLLGRR